MRAAPRGSRRGRHRAGRCAGSRWPRGRGGAGAVRGGARCRAAAGTRGSAPQKGAPRRRERAVRPSVPPEPPPVRSVQPSVGTGARGRGWLRSGGSRPLRNQPQVRGGSTCRHDEPHRREPPHSAERRQQHPALGAGHLRRPAESKSGGAGTPRVAGGGRCGLPSLQPPEPRVPSSFPPVPATSLIAPFPVRS